MSFSYDKGLMWMEDLLEIAYKFEFIKRLTSVTYQFVNLETGEIYKTEDGKELTGKRKDLEEYLYTHPEFQNDFMGMLNRYISASDDSYGEILDERDRVEIKSQEDSVDANMSKAIVREDK